MRHLALLGLLVLLSTAESRLRRNVQFQHFDDFLMSALTTRNSDFNQVLKVPSESEQPTPGPSPGSSPGPSPTPARHSHTEEQSDILGYFRDVPREHWSCCMLGKLAGDKGFHCHVNFYAERLQSRNQNRAQNSRTPMHGSSRIPRWGREIMGTFQRCVARHGTDFHKCCYAATVEQRERHRWHRYRVTETRQPADRVTERRQTGDRATARRQPADRITERRQLADRRQPTDTSDEQA